MTDTQTLFTDVSATNRFSRHPGATMPPVEGCKKQGYAVLFVIAVAVDN